MLQVHTIAEAIKTRLLEIPELKGKVVAFHQPNIDAEVEGRLNKTGGLAVVIRLTSTVNASKSRKSSYYVGRYTVSLWTLKLLSPKDVTRFDALEAAIEAKLQGWWPANVPSNKVMWIQCDGHSYPENPIFHVSSLSISAPGNLN
jgi:hypothetical protein